MRWLSCAFWPSRAERLSSRQTIPYIGSMPNGVMDEAERDGDDRVLFPADLLARMKDPDVGHAVTVPSDQGQLAPWQASLSR
jgi:hypothetical protein